MRRMAITRGTSVKAARETIILGNLTENETRFLIDYIDEKLTAVNAALEGYLPSLDLEPKVIHKCMHHATAGGKRLRAVLVLAAAEVFGGDTSIATPTACAIELIHSHSLVLDDLPCMDNHSHRRGQPTCHNLFGESTALLAADALLNLAVSILARNHRDLGIDPGIALEIIKEVGEVVGTSGMIGAQLADLAGPGSVPELTVIEQIEMGKTGVLFRLSTRAGACLCGADEGQMAALSAYGERLGLAFQIADDLLDITSDQRSSRDGRKPVNYALISGVKKTQKRLKDLTEGALGALSVFGEEAEPLRHLAHFNASREV